MTTTFALAGRRIDAPNASLKRFPLEQADAVSDALRRAFIVNGVRSLVCSAAAGADLLALKVAFELKVSVRIILSASRDAFRRASVADRGQPWAILYDRLVSAVPEEEIRIIPPSRTADATLRSVNREILIEAIRLASMPPESKLLCGAVWDCKEKAGEDYTADFIGQALALGLEVYELNTNFPVLGFTKVDR